MSRQPPTDAFPSFNPTEASARSVGALAPLAPAPPTSSPMTVSFSEIRPLGTRSHQHQAQVKRLPRDSILRPAGCRCAPRQADGRTSATGRTRGPSGAALSSSRKMAKMGWLRPVALWAQTGTVMESTKGLGPLLLGLFLLLLFLGERKVASLCARRVRTLIDTEVRGKAHR